MSTAGERARWYLERTVPQLHEWEDKGIFTKEEIRTIVKKRNEFEYRILGPRAQPAHFSAYAAYERALLALLRRRLARLRIHQLSSLAHAFSARPTAILERGVDRHPASAALWREYLQACSQRPNVQENNDLRGNEHDVIDGETRGNKRPLVPKGSTKRWRKAMTRALRLLPTDAGLWAMAGRRAAHDGDWERMRGVFMRGCRFCTAEGGEEVWLEFARWEMEWLAWMGKKRRGANTRGKWGGGDARWDEKPGAALTANDEGENYITLHDEDDDDDDDDHEDSDGDENGAIKGGARAGQLVLPDPAERGRDDLLSALKAASETTALTTAKEVAPTPAMSGAIPLSILAVAAKQPFFRPDVAAAFMDLFAGFHVSPHVPAVVIEALVQAVVDAAREKFAVDAAMVLFVRQPVAGRVVTGLDFATGLREMLTRLWATTEELSQDEVSANADREVAETKGGNYRRRTFIEQMVGVIKGWLTVEGVDESVVTVMEDTKTKLTRML